MSGGAIDGLTLLAAADPDVVTRNGSVPRVGVGDPKAQRS
jgi:hypothetical protein